MVRSPRRPYHRYPLYSRASTRTLCGPLYKSNQHRQAPRHVSQPVETATDSQKTIRIEEMEESARIDSQDNGFGGSHPSVLTKNCFSRLHGISTHFLDG